MGQTRGHKRLYFGFVTEADRVGNIPAGDDAVLNGHQSPDTRTDDRGAVGGGADHLPGRQSVISAGKP